MYELASGARLSNTKRNEMVYTASVTTDRITIRCPQLDPYTYKDISRADSLCYLRIRHDYDKRH